MPYEMHDIPDLVKAGRHQEIVDVLSAVERDEGLTFGHSMQLARSMFSLGLVAEAKRQAEKTELFEALNVVELEKLVSLHAEMRAHHRVSKFGRSVLTRYPGLFSVRERVVMALIEERDLARSRRYLEEALNDVELDARTLMRISNLFGVIHEVFYRLGWNRRPEFAPMVADGDQAFDVAARAVAREPNSFLANLTFASAALRVGKNDVASHQIKLILDVCQPDSAADWLRFADILLKLGTTGQVEDAVRRASVLDDWKQSPIIWGIRLLTQIDSKEFALELVYSINLGLVSDRTQLKTIHECFYKFGDHKSALEIANRSLRLYDEDPFMKERSTLLSLLVLHAETQPNLQRELRKRGLFGAIRQVAGRLTR